MNRLATAPRSPKRFGFADLGRSLTWLVCCCALTSACVRKAYPPQPVVAEVSVETESVDPDPLLAGLATTASERFLGIWDGVAFEYEVYDPDSLRKDLTRVERYLARKGYYEAKVVAARVIAVDEHRVRVEIRVTEGAPVMLTSITPRGLEHLPIEVAARVLRNNPLRPGQPLDEDEYEASKVALLRTLKNSGYAFATVQGTVRVDIARHEASVQYDVDPGAVAYYGPIEVEGLEEIPRETVLDNMGLQRGAPYSQRELDDASRALINLNVFTSVQVKADKERARGTEIPVTVTVREADLRALKVGAGVQLDSLQASNHVTLGWEDKNFLGGLRRLSIDTKPGLVYNPTRLSNLTVPKRALYQQQIRAELRQPSLFEGRTTGYLSGTFSVSPLLYPDTREDEGVIGFSEIRAGGGLERAFWAHRVFISPSYNWQLAQPVDYAKLTIGPEVPAADELLADLIIAYPELVLGFDLRDDRLVPRRGIFLNTSVQVANPIFGSDVSDVRIKPDARFYVPISGNVVFATRFTTGLLLAGNYGETLSDGDAFSDAQTAQDQQKLLFRGFFSGGPNSNRGYPLRGVGPHGDVKFLTRNVDCDAQPDLRACNRPLGGVTLWEASLEVRFGLFGPLSAVVFVDASDVSRELTLRFSAPHLSAGLGFRYGTPIGPVRFDIGYRVPGAQDFRNDVPEGDPRDTLGLPIAMHLTLGEAF